MPKYKLQPKDMFTDKNGTYIAIVLNITNDKVLVNIKPKIQDTIDLFSRNTYNEVVSLQQTLARFEYGELTLRRSFNVGNKVICDVHGKGIVFAITKHPDLPIMVGFEDGHYRRYSIIGNYINKSNDFFNFDGVTLKHL